MLLFCFLVSSTGTDGTRRKKNSEEQQFTLKEERVPFEKENRLRTTSTTHLISQEMFVERNEVQSSSNQKKRTGRRRLGKRFLGLHKIWLEVQLKNTFCPEKFANGVVF